MSNVVVMFSGGSNSTYALWRWLSETDHAVTAVRGRIQDAAPGRLTEENVNTRAVQIVNWLQENVRDFDYETIDFPAYEQEEGPLRPGYAATYNYGALRPRYAGYGQVISDKNPDIFVIGYSLENSSSAGYLYFRSLFENSAVQIFFAGSPNLTEPVPQGDEYDDLAVAKTLTGKCFQYASLPDELKTFAKNWDGNEADPRNIDMLYSKAIDKWLSDGKDPAEFDRYCAELGCYGPYADRADPNLAIWRSSQFLTDGFVENYLADIAGIERHWKNNVS